MNWVTKPLLGYAIVRFKALNPGYWPLHCHNAMHNMEGMMLLLHVKDSVHNRPLSTVPEGLPRCGSHEPSETLPWEIIPNVWLALYAINNPFKFHSALRNFSKLFSTLLTFELPLPISILLAYNVKIVVGQNRPCWTESERKNTQKTYIYSLFHSCYPSVFFLGARFESACIGLAICT